MSDSHSSSASPSASPRFRSILGLVALSVLVLLVFGGLKTHRDLSIARARETSLERDLLETGERIEALETRIERLKTDPALLEKLAREELGMVKPGELVILVDPEPGSAGEPVQASPMPAVE